MAFLKFVFFLVVGIWFAGLIFRATVTRWFNRRAAEYERATKQAGHEARKQGKGRREGEVIIESSRREQKKIRRDVGDYVEFEEVTEVVEKREDMSK